MRVGASCVRTLERCWSRQVSSGVPLSVMHAQPRYSSGSLPSERSRRHRERPRHLVAMSVSQLRMSGKVSALASSLCLAGWSQPFLTAVAMNT